MSKNIFSEQYEDYIKNHLHSVRNIIKNEKHLQPFLTILVENKTDKERSCICAPLPHQLLEKDDSNNYLLYMFFKELKEHIEKNNNRVLCVNFNAEAWATKVHKVTEKELEKKEIVIMTFDCEEANTFIVFDINREMKVTDKGIEEYVDIEPTEENGFEAGDNIGGRFTNLYEKIVNA